jgi:O-antigen/teichoic acid export membrane protein
MRNVRFTVVKNALANVTKGGAAALVALALPHFLTRSLDHDRFGAWSLMLQLAAYASYLDFGLQTAVARFLAYYVERGDEERRDWLISTALMLLLLAGIVALLTVSMVALQLPRIFRGIPSSLVTELKYATMVLGGSTALLLPLSAFSGALVGLHRNEYVAGAVGGSRTLGAIAVLIAARHTQSLVMLAACLASANLLGGLAQVAAVRVLLPSLRISYLNVRRAMAKDLSRYCAGLTIWSFSMFLVSGLDLTIVGHFNFAAVGYYSVAASLITFFSGANGAVCSALMTPIATLHASRSLDRIRTLILSATRLNTFANLIATVILLLSGPSLLRVWVGASYARPALPIVEILMIANVVRLVANPYSFMLIATDQQKYGVAQGMIEGIMNCGSSVLGALWLGPIGVAVGTLVGAIFGLAWTSTLTIKWVREIPFDRWNFVREGVLRPVTCTLPLVLFVALMHNRLLTSRSVLVLALCGVGTYLLTDYFGRVLPASLQMRRLFA